MSRAHPRRSAARRTSSSSGKDVSIKRLPGWYGGPARCPSANTPRRTRRSAGIRIMWHSHCCLRVRTAVRMSYEGVVASSRHDCFDMCSVMCFLLPLPLGQSLCLPVHPGPCNTAIVNCAHHVVVSPAVC